MRPNPLTDLAFLVETDKLWFTLIFWLLLLGSVAAAYTASSSPHRVHVTAFRQ